MKTKITSRFLDDTTRRIVKLFIRIKDNEEGLDLLKRMSSVLDVVNLRYL